LKRAFDQKDGEMTTLQKIQKQDAEEEYKVSKDKLGCPMHYKNHKCQREQSFTEWWDKKRICPECKVRYVKMNVCDPSKFDRRMKEKSKLREERLKKVEHQMYSYEKPQYQRPKAFQPDLPSSNKGNNNGLGLGFGNDAKDVAGNNNSNSNSNMPSKAKATTKLREPVMKSVGQISVPAKRAAPSAGTTATTAAAAAAAAGDSKSEEDLSAELLTKLANLNSSKAALMEQVVAAAEDKVRVLLYYCSSFLPFLVHDGLFVSLIHLLLPSCIL
jgi:hypothetical protein